MSHAALVPGASKLAEAAQEAYAGRVTGLIATPAPPIPAAAGPIPVRIWMAECGPALADHLPALFARLDAERQARILRLHRPGDRLQQALAHVLLDAALRAEGIAAPRFRLGPQGKPALADAAAGLHFNLTHTDGLVACALARRHELGVDAEAVDRPVDHLGLARAICSAEEMTLLRQAAAPAEAFFAIWTAKEAVAKAIGLGLQMPLEQVTCLPGASRPRFAAELGWDAAEWHLQAWAPTPRHRLALAVRGSAGQAFAARPEMVAAEVLALSGRLEIY